MNELDRDPIAFDYDPEERLAFSFRGKCRTGLFPLRLDTGQLGVELKEMPEDAASQ
jgi:hypothetical protein